MTLQKEAIICFNRKPILLIYSIINFTAQLLQNSCCVLNLGESGSFSTNNQLHTSNPTGTKALHLQGHVP